MVITYFFCNSDLSRLSEDCCKLVSECLHVAIIVQMVHCYWGLCGNYGRSIHHQFLAIHAAPLKAHPLNQVFGIIVT